MLVLKIWFKKSWKSIAIYREIYFLSYTPTHQNKMAETTVRKRVNIRDGRKHADVAKYLLDV